MKLRIKQIIRVFFIILPYIPLLLIFTNIHLENNIPFLFTYYYFFSSILSVGAITLSYAPIIKSKIKNGYKMVIFAIFVLFSFINLIIIIITFFPILFHLQVVLSGERFESYNTTDEYILKVEDPNNENCYLISRIQSNIAPKEVHEMEYYCKLQGPFIFYSNRLNNQIQEISDQLDERESRLREVDEFIWNQDGSIIVKISEEESFIVKPK